ncbi:MAG: amidohydrolase family protein [Betaproteobacteria bacterium]|nr:amidohydrolase family protein [Betaproteobacteria bacterium]
MLIRNAEIDFSTIVDLRIANEAVTDIGQHLQAHTGEVVVEADGAALLPGLLDHHLHLAALASSLESAVCGPPQVRTAEELALSLLKSADANSVDSDGWIRGIAYHESVAGNIDRDWIDRVLLAQPVRIQHRSGRLWIVNSCALERLGGGEDAPLERVAGRPTGRIYDADTWLRQRLARELPALQRASKLLASYGVTGVTDASPNNGLSEIRHFSAEQACGHLLQDVLALGNATLDGAAGTFALRIGARKIHLREATLPDFDIICAEIDTAHAAGRAVAIHCVTRVELVFALTALAEAGHHRDDRIEHASVAPPDVLPLLAAAGVTVVTQPNFVYERGDDYISEVGEADRPWLYRCQGVLDAGIALAAGTDAPFGDADPWRAMHAAVTRRTRSGAQIGSSEALSPNRALALFLTDAQDPGGPPRRISPNSRADLCLLDRPWRNAQLDLSAVRVKATFKAGRMIWRRQT